jgi:hypothetical protein
MDRKLYAQILILLLIPTLPQKTEAMATLYVDPPTTITSIDDTFSINITVSDVTDLGGWEFKLYYLSSKLNGTNIIEGPFLKQGGYTYFAIVNFIDTYNSTHGIAWVTCTLLGTDPGVNGNGTLATITFKAKQLGTSSLSLTDTWLSDSQPISHKTLNGLVVVTWLGDFDVDFDVDEDDLWYFCARFIDYYKIHVKDPLCDFDKDGDIDEDDLWTFCEAFIDYWNAH